MDNAKEKALEKIKTLKKNDIVVLNGGTLAEVLKVKGKKRNYCTLIDVAIVPDFDDEDEEKTEDEYDYLNEPYTLSYEETLDALTLRHSFETETFNIAEILEDIL